MDPRSDNGDKTWTMGRLLQWTSGYLADHEVEDARLATEVLLAHAAGCRRIELYTRFESSLAADPLERFRGWVKRAANHEPIAYLVGEKEFFSLPFAVTRDVLIPRPETELLVESAIDHCRVAELPGPRILDLGTGSGCIAVALLTQLPEGTAIAIDVSDAALAVARRNAERHGVANRCKFLLADRLQLPADAVPVGSIDILVSNPPYIPGNAAASVDRSVRLHEPTIAWTDGGDGLSFYRTISIDAPALLTGGGVVFVEIGDGQARKVVEIMESAGRFRHHRTCKDRTVGTDRVLMFTRLS